MERAERAGLSAAVVGHLALLAILSVSIAHRMPPVRPQAEAMDVQLVDAVGLRSAAPEPATEAPQEAEAPEAGPPKEAAPPPPEPAPLKPVPPTPQPVPQPKPAPPKPVVAEAPPKPAPAKPALAKPITDILKDVRAAAKSEKVSRAAPDASANAERAAGSRIGPNFLKGVLGASAGKGERARASVTGPALNGLGAAIKRQVQPCYDLGALGGTPAMRITTVLQLRFNPDGSVAGTPQLVEQQGVDDDNRAYAKQMVDVSRRAVLRCAPLKLPPELYAGGWENITMGFIPGQMR